MREKNERAAEIEMQASDGSAREEEKKTASSLEMLKISKLGQNSQEPQRLRCKRLVGLKSDGGTRDEEKRHRRRD
ncbi:hypothetical protein VitviT2T_007089 [Vitis vinifera]|uniref:Uncharacterized protein n=1 Tax=Vitis vinifera TaxID=29760 RepID=A0ABY9BYX7_VITVI|nr:hypothetical protein VitviT2T_007089 [Vitis vinifera]